MRGEIIIVQEFSCFGARPFCAFYVKFYCSVDKIAVTWSNFISPLRSLAAALWSKWSLFMRLLEHPDQQGITIVKRRDNKRIYYFSCKNFFLYSLMTVFLSLVMLLRWKKAVLAILLHELYTKDWHQYSL